MNKNELITFLRNPNDLTESDLAELEKIVKNNPYFLSGRLLLAKGSKELNHPDTRKRVSSAAVYSTDRPLLKKYISGKLFFLSKPPEKEEIIEPVTAKETKNPKTESGEKSQKIEIISSKKPEEPKESNQSSKEKVKPDEPKQDLGRREPRFDPSATASFKRRWDVKSEPAITPKSKESENKPTNKPVFAGKKVDRSNRVRKKSIREELLNESSSPTKKAKPPVPQEKISSPKEEKVIVSKDIAKPRVEEANPKASPQKSTPPPPVMVKPTIARSSDSLESKERPKTIPNVTKPKTSPSLVNNKTAPKKVIAKEKEHVPVVIKKVSKTSLQIPELPSDGIDTILEELQKDMENLKSSRTKFTEVQQKIEEDDAVSAALARATKKHSEANKESIPEERVPENKEELSQVNSDSPTIKEVDQEDKLENEEDPLKVEQKKSEEDKKIVTEPKPSPKPKKKVTSEKPKSKKVAAKKTTAVKKEAIKKPKTPKKSDLKKSDLKETKSSKKNKKEEDDKKNKSKADQDTIIDKFIAETPSIKYQKKGEPSENLDLSDKSTEWNKEFASEYLAEIYLHQGNKKRAIEIYTALSLKFPEKKSYFADLISKTK